MADSSNVKHMEPQEVQKMIDLLRMTARLLREQVSSEAKQIAQSLENGILLGSAGEAMSGAFKSTLTSSLDDLAANLEKRATFAQQKKEEFEREARNLR